MDLPNSHQNDKIIVSENATWRFPEAEYHKMVNSVVRRQNSLRNSMLLKIKRNRQMSISKERNVSLEYSESRRSSKKYSYESRHKHALRRQRDSKGRFVGGASREVSDKSQEAGKGKKKSKSMDLEEGYPEADGFFPRIDYSHLFEDIEENPEEEEDFLFGNCDFEAGDKFNLFSDKGFEMH